MPLSTGDLRFHAAADAVEDDLSQVGGAVNTSVLVTFNDISASDVVEALSTAGGDAGITGTVFGRTSDGTPVSENLVLVGTNPVTGSQNFARINKIGLSAAGAGTIVFRKSSDDATIASIPAGMTGIRRLFINAAAEAAGGGVRQFYEKIFIRNNSSTNALLNGIISENADPTTYVDFALASGFNDSATVTGRLNSAGALPVSSGSFNSLSKSVISGGTLGTGVSLGIWLRLQLPAGATPTGSTYTINVAGSTT